MAAMADRECPSWNGNDDRFGGRIILCVLIRFLELIVDGVVVVDLLVGSVRPDIVCVDIVCVIVAGLIQFVVEDLIGIVGVDDVSDDRSVCQRFDVG